MALFSFPKERNVYECLQFSECIYKNYIFINSAVYFSSIYLSTPEQYKEISGAFLVLLDLFVTVIQI